MLNEIVEFDNYTYHLDSSEPVNRLKHKNLSNSLSGITRAMTIIARKCYFEENVIDKRRHCKNTLRVWCGDSKGDEDEAMDGIIGNWLSNYVIEVLGSEKCEQFRKYLKNHKDVLGDDYETVNSLFNDLWNEIIANPLKDKERRTDILINCNQIKRIINKNCELTQDPNLKMKFAPVNSIVLILDMIRKRCGNKGFNGKMFSEKLEKSDKNDYKKITYDKIIAEAVKEGRLEKHYLVCASDNLDEVCYKDKYPFKKKKNSKTSKKKADLLRKVVAAFLLEKKRHTDSSEAERFIPVNFSDIRNWLVSDIDIKLEAYSYKEKPLFDQEVINMNQKQIRINKEWMDCCGWKIVHEAELESYLKEHPGATFFSDWGAGQMLKANCRY